MNLTIGEILERKPPEWFKEPFVQKLNKETQRIIAASTLLIAKKKKKGLASLFKKK